MNQASLKATQKKCNQCGSPLFIVGKKTEQIENYSPVIVTMYKCSNKDCQDDIDKKTLARMKDTSEQKIAKENRVKAKIKTMRIHKKKILR